MDIAEDSFVEDDIPESESVDYPYCLVPFSGAASENRILMYLPVVASELPHGIPFARGVGFRIPSDTTRIHPVRFLQLMPYPRILCDVPERH